MHAWTALLLALAACSADPLEVHLELRADTCDAAALAEVSVVSVEIYGDGAGGSLCALGRRCLFGVDPLGDLDDLAAALRDANQPLIDAELAGARYIHVVGRADNCWDLPDPALPAPSHPVCGSNDLAEIDGDVLPIEMDCDGCPADEEVPLCE